MQEIDRKTQLEGNFITTSDDESLQSTTLEIPGSGRELNKDLTDFDIEVLLTISSDFLSTISIIPCNCKSFKAFDT